MHRRTPITGLTLLCVVALMGCDTTKPSAAPIPSPTSIAAATVAPTVAATVAPIAGANVLTEENLAKSADLTEAGGTITATGSNGAVYTLVIPPGALAQPTTISLHPVTSVATLPTGRTLAAGVQFAPDGLQLLAPSTLTIDLPNGKEAASVGGIGWRGDGAAVHAVPTFAQGSTLTFTVLHFSGDAAAEPGLAPLEPLVPCSTNDLLDERLADVAPGPAGLASQFRAVLEDCYRDFVVPTLNGAISDAQGNITPTSEIDGDDAYNSWLAGIDLARRRLNDQGFTVAELPASKRLATSFLQAWYAYWNRACVKVKDQEWHVPVKDARIGLAESHQPAISWGIATRANRLDLQSLLDNLCVKVLIDPGRGFTASAPGEDGTIKVKAGISIDHGSLVTAAGMVRVHVTMTGSTIVIGDGLTDAGGLFTAATTWPHGTDPVRYDILATLIDNESIDDSVIESIDVPTDIQRFDRITKRSERLSFTFSSGLDGWSKGTLGGPGDLVDNEHVGNGEAHMDGRGTGSAGKAWIDRTFTLPQAVTTFSFDLSAEVIAGSSSSARVVIEAGGTSKSFNFAISNATNHLSYKRETIDLRPWAGQRVKIFVEQNYNGLGGFDKEIYVDNIRIATG